MKEILITSSVLIAALLILRALFRRKLSRRVQYALWGLVLLRLLVPVSLPGTNFSVLTAAYPVERAVEFRLRQPLGHPAPQEQEEKLSSPSEQETHSEEMTSGPAAKQEKVGESPALPAPFSTAQALRFLWYAGAAAVGSYFLLWNLRLYHRLRKNRTPYRTEGFSGPVYLVGNGVLSSPCLFGLFRPAVYLTPAALKGENTLRHVLIHEKIHARHLDPLWSLLRCVCLTVYWFDPLVWAAAFASRTDCELACDESVLALLGEKERIPYGQTLLSLIPVKRGPANPLLTATTMAAGKKQIKSRISRIANQPRRFLAGTCAVVILAGVLAACTFTGAAVSEDFQNEPDGPETESGFAALTEDRLRWFNQEFFNTAATGSNSINIRNQFANPVNLYDKPEEIDLYQLLYMGLGTEESGKPDVPTGKELEAVLGLDPKELPYPAYVLAVSDIDELLKKHMGLTVEQTRKKGLEHFTYSEEYQAYHCMHGDTNYCQLLDFLCGIEDEKFVKLYHNSDFTGGGWYCVTFSKQEDGSYRFVSNQACEQPSIPTPLPAAGFSTSLSLAGLEPYIPEAVTTVSLPAEDFVGNSDDLLENWLVDEQNIQIYRAADGGIRAAVVREDGSRLVFLSGLDEESSLSLFQNLFGQNGFSVSYRGQNGADLSGPAQDLYVLGKDGAPTLLARCPASSDVPKILDLDGDGTNELVCGSLLFFQRDGQIFKAQLDALLQAACPELTGWSSCVWDPYGKYCRVQGPDETGGQSPQWVRYLFFDSQRILVYQNEDESTGVENS